MSDQFWNILFWVALVALYIVLWLHGRRCKAKGIKPKPAYNRFKKHGKRISKWTDIFIISIILLGTIVYGSMLFMVNHDALPDIPPEYTQSNTQIVWSINFLLLFHYSFWAVFMASLLSPFQKNITLTKRLVLTVMCCVALVFGVLFCIFDDSQRNPFHFKLLLGALFSLALINGPAILLGKPFIELLLCLHKKFLPWLQIPEENESDKV